MCRAVHFEEYHVRVAKSVVNTLNFTREILVAGESHEARQDGTSV